MPTCHLVDYLGVHCGMHYYLEAFKRVLSSIPEMQVRILSNYSDDEEPPFFKNQYKGNVVCKGSALISNLLRLRRFAARHKDDLFIYLTYGNSIDLYFMQALSKADNVLIDIHEAIAQNVDSNERLKRRFKDYYRNPECKVISHSSRTDDFLKEYGFTGRRFSVPHFKYVFPKDFDASALSHDISEAPDASRVNLLFFGNLNESKGVDILMEAINRLPEDVATKANFIIAGKDFDGAVHRVAPAEGRSVCIFPRHITDDELRFLYQNVDYLCLPYRKTSQSGILEMAFYFKRPIIASDVTYFRNTLKEFPSFGMLSGNDAASYSESIAKAIENHRSSRYFTDSDYARYENRREIRQFIERIKDWASSL